MLIINENSKNIYIYIYTHTQKGMDFKNCITILLNREKVYFCYK